MGFLRAGLAFALRSIAGTTAMFAGITAMFRRHHRDIAGQARRASLTLRLRAPVLVDASVWSLPLAHMQKQASVARLAPSQCIEREQDLTGLAPEGCLVPAQPVKRGARQVGQTQEATGEVAGRTV
jgi:hypothetical protein